MRDKKNVAGNPVNTRPIEPDEQYWTEIIEYPKGGDPRIKYEFAYVNSINFLQNRGFARFRRLDGSWQFIHLTPPTVRFVEAFEIRDFVVNFTKALRLNDVSELLCRGGSRYLSQDFLSNLAFIDPEFAEPRRDEQIFYFNDYCWKINKQTIEQAEYTATTRLIWANQCKSFAAKRTESLIDIRKMDDGHFEYSLSKTGEVCHFLQFLINTSNFTWRKEKENLPVDPEEYIENNDHLIAKLCSIGYLLLSYKDPNVSRAVVAVDCPTAFRNYDRRSGKSVLGEMFKHVLPAVALNGKTKDIEGDTFVWTELTERTKIVFIDDIRTNFSLESLSANISGDWMVNYKGGGRITFPFSQSPKIYITSNHALYGYDFSFMDRLWLIPFSDFYNGKHKPVDDFGSLFFREWGFEQWNLLWNLLAECVRLYLRFGVVQAPVVRLTKNNKKGGAI